MKVEIASTLREVIMNSLYKPEEIKDPKVPPEGAVIVQGLTQNWGFHPVRLESHKEKIKEIINLMPKEFHQSTGGGMSFLNMCVDKDGHQWGEHRNMEELVVLSIGLKLGEYCMPRDMWDVLPGGMPYIMFKDQQ